MIATALVIAFAAVGTAFVLNLYRILQGPSLPDRVLGLDALSFDAIALLMLTGLHLGDAMFFAPALVIAMLGFISTVAFCFYLLRGEVIE